MENRGRIAEVASSALHYGKTATNKSTLVGEAMIPKAVNFQESFHSITFEWLEDELNFYLDNDTKPYFTVNSKLDAFNKFGYPFNSSYYLIINLLLEGFMMTTMWTVLHFVLMKNVLIKKSLIMLDS